MASLTRDIPRIESISFAPKKKYKVIKNCESCKHEVGYLCNHKDSDTKKFSKLTMAQCWEKKPKKKAKAVCQISIN